jgi:hypothetical protein
MKGQIGFLAPRCTRLANQRCGKCSGDTVRWISRRTFGENDLRGLEAICLDRLDQEKPTQVQKDQETKIQREQRRILTEPDQNRKAIVGVGVETGDVAEVEGDGRATVEIDDVQPPALKDAQPP